MRFLPQYFFKKLSTLSTKGALIACTLFSPIALAICNPNAPTTTPSNNFTVHNNGTVTHKPTNLMWKVCTEGQTWAWASCNGATTLHTWHVAEQIPETLNGSGGFPLSEANISYTDWRLPTLKELKSIVELQCYNPAINTAIFPKSKSYFYWSSTPHATNNVNTWGVHFINGDDSFNHNNFNFQVRLVRSEQ